MHFLGAAAVVSHGLNCNDDKVFSPSPSETACAQWIHKMVIFPKAGS